jgi:PDZ domain-containing protein
VLIVALALVVTALVVPVPYYLLEPGAARPVEPLISVKELKAQKAESDILFVTVDVVRPRGIQALRGWLDDDVDVLPAKEIDGTQSNAENNRFNLQLMTTSKDTATKIALQKLGYKVDVHDVGAAVVDLAPDFPVARVVHPGDTIIKADGAPIHTRDGLVKAIAKHRPHDPMTLTVESFPDNLVRTVHTTVGANPADPKEARLGVSIETRQKYGFPAKVDIDSGQIGGPSAGLAFTLSLIDRLTPGSLTGGHKVAVTGTIEVNGSVGPVGGVRQKTVAAIAAGATVFIVPSDEYRDARRVAHGRLQVKKADTLDQALRILAGIGGNAGRLGTPGR